MIRTGQLCLLHCCMVAFALAITAGPSGPSGAHKAHDETTGRQPEAHAWAGTSVLAFGSLWPWASERMARGSGRRATLRNLLLLQALLVGRTGSRICRRQREAEKKKARLRLTSMCMAALFLWPASVSADSPDEVLALLIEEAVKQNPSVESMRDRTRELGELADIANTWQDARFAVEYMNAPVDSFSIKDSPMSGVQFTLQQRLPGWGWTRAARQMAEHGVERSRHARAEAEVQLGLSVETLYWSLALSRQLKGVTEKHLDLTLELVRAVQARYEVGKAGQNALLRLDVLRERLEDDLGDYDRADRRLSAGLARALARSPDSGFETPVEVAALPPTGELADWIEQARKSRPELAAIQEEIKQKEKSAALSRIGVRPEVDVWVRYRVRTVETPTDDGTDFFSAGVSIPIPWGSARRGLGGQAAELAARDGARSRFAAALDQIDAELIEVDASWQRAAEKAITYKNRLIPSAGVVLETTLSDFSVGKAGFSTLYEAQVDLLVLERSYLNATIETRIQRAIARAVTGSRDLGDPS